MFSKVALLAIASLIFSAAAGNVSKCNTGEVQCCDSLHQSDSRAGSFLASAVGVNVQNVQTLVGFDCSPITVGVAEGSGAKCAVQPVCCDSNHFEGLVTVGCTAASA